jgi:hypothetical protein
LEPVRKPWEPVVPVRIGSGRFPTGPNSKFEFDLKKYKISQNSQKYFKVCKSTGIKNFQIFIRLYSLRALEVELKKKKEKKLVG